MHAIYRSGPKCSRHPDPMSYDLVEIMSDSQHGDGEVVHLLAGDFECSACGDILKRPLRSVTVEL